MDFGFFKGLPYEKSEENFDDYKKFKNTIPKAKVIEHIKSLDAGLTTLPSHDFFTGEKLHAGMFWDGDFTFPYEFLHYYENYDIGIPPEYEEYLKSIGVG
jgi:hypothetical protein